MAWNIVYGAYPTSTVTPTQGALAVGGVAPVLSFGTVQSPAAGALALAGVAGSATYSDLPGTGILLTQGYNPTVTNSATSNPPTSVLLINQGGPNNGGSAGTYVFNGNTFTYSNTANANYQALSWLPPASGATTSFNIYRATGISTSPSYSLYDSISTPITVQGYISNGSGSAGTVFVVTSVSGGSSTNGIADGKLLPGAQLQSSASGFVSGSTIVLYTTANTGGGGTGTYSVNFSQLVGSSGSPATFTVWSYSDTAATNCVPVKYDQPATVYSYKVTAIQSGKESAAAYPSVYYYRGISYTIDSQFSYGGVTQVWNDTSGSPVNGPYDVQATYPSGAGGFLPVMGNGGDGRGNQTIFDDLEVGAFNYLVFDCNFQTSPLQESLQIIPQSRAYGTTGGSVDVGANIQFNINSYGTPILNGWSTFKIPFSALNWGIVQFTGYIVGTGTYAANLVVTSIQSKTNVGLVACGRVTGNGTPANSYITGPGGPQFGTGTYALTGPNLTSSTAIGSSGSPVALTMTLTNCYKIGWQWGATVPTQEVCFNNMGFTTV